MCYFYETLIINIHIKHIYFNKTMEVESYNVFPKILSLKSDIHFLL